MSVRVLHCSVCQHNFDTKRGWLSHLLKPYHQTKARKEICRWNQPEKERVLVAFSTSPIASDELLQFFSSGVNNLITDFVWFESRPKMGFLQFESKHKVEQVLSSFSAPEIRINNQLIQIKKAGECLRLEWQEIIPFPTDELLEDSEEKISLCYASEMIASSSKLIFADQKICDRDDDLLQDGQTSALAQVVPGDPDRSPPDQSKELLVNHYKRICKAIEISAEDYKSALKFLDTLKKLLDKKFTGCQLILFRNWFLMLKNTLKCDKLIFFIDRKGMYSKYSAGDRTAVNNFPPAKKGLIAKALLGSSVTKRLGIEKRKRVAGNSPENHAYTYHCKAVGGITRFGVVLNPVCVLPEIQACRLLSYLCTFDPRVKPLLTVVRYWAIINGIILGNPSEKRIDRTVDPAALDWLVIFFLCYKKKILPTPREVTQRPHQKLDFNRLDIGFLENVTFARKYSSRYQETDEEAHVFNVFNLAQELFHFYSTELHLDKGERVVFNTKDGELIPIKEFAGEITTIPTKLDRLERKLVRRGKVQVKDVVLLHPLHVRFGFSFCDKNFVTIVCPAMQTTGMKLKQGLDLYKRGKKFDMRSTFEVDE